MAPVQYLIVGEPLGTSTAGVITEATRRLIWNAGVGALITLDLDPVAANKLIALSCLMVWTGAKGPANPLIVTTPPFTDGETRIIDCAGATSVSIAIPFNNQALTAGQVSVYVKNCANGTPIQLTFTNGLTWTPGQWQKTVYMTFGYVDSAGANQLFTYVVAGPPADYGLSTLGPAILAGDTCVISGVMGQALITQVMTSGVPSTAVLSSTAATLDGSNAWHTVETTNTAAVTLTLPADANNAAGPWSSFTEIAITQIGAGQVTVVPDAGVTLNSPGSLRRTRVQYSTIRLRWRSPNSWVLSGDLG